MSSSYWPSTMVAWSPRLLLGCALVTRRLSTPFSWQGNGSRQRKHSCTQQILMCVMNDLICVQVDVLRYY